MVINPNWPVMLYEWAPRWNVNGAAQPLDQYADVTSRTRSATSIQRGRQYELDQVRSGTLDMQLANNDGALDPLNTAGPWYGHIMPFQPARVRAQWPPTVNMLTQVQATGGDLGGYSPGPIPGGQQGISVFSQTDTSGGSIVTSATAWQGTTVFQFAVLSTATAGQRICFTPQASVEINVPYSQQMRVRNVTAGTSLQVQPIIRWFNASLGVISTSTGATVTLTGSPTAAWTQLTVSGTAPATAAFMYVGVALVSAPASTANVQVDGWQVERAAAPTTWVQPGVTYPLWAGWVERWPSSWTMSGTYGLVSPTGVDTFALLSQRVLRDPLTEEIYRHNPRFLYTFSDPQGSPSFADAIGAYPPAPPAVSKYGAGSVTAGAQITSATAGGAYTGSTGTVITVANANPGTNLLSAATFPSLGSAGITGPAQPSGSWSRMLAFRYTAGTPAANACMWTGFDGQRANDNPSGSRLLWYLDNAGRFNVAMSGPSGATVGFIPSATTCADGNWHLAILSYSHTTATLIINLDGTNYSYSSFNPIYEPSGLISDNIGAYVDPTTGNGTIQTWQGDISFATEWPTALSTTDMTAIFTAWKNSFTGDSTSARYSRVLGWAGYSGPTSIQTGLTTSMGPAETNGQDALSALQAVVDTENGEHFVDRAGAVTFRARSARYNALTPMFTFGENTAGGEIPYESLQLDYDPTRLANQVTVTQASTNQVVSAQDSASIANFFPRQLTRTVNTSSTAECQDAANYLLSRYKNPAVRVSSITLHPSANPSVLWPVCLSLELGTRVRVMRRPPAPAAAIQAEVFIESIAWDLTDDGEARVTLQCSPVDLTPYGVFASFHTTLVGSPGSGASSITITNGQDNTNLAAAQLSYGQQLVLGQGTANQETVTIKAVGATSPGWTTAVITLQAATTKAHTAGDVVCEPLPAGTTDPTTWDTVSKFDSSAFAY